MPPPTAVDGADCEVATAIAVKLFPVEPEIDLFVSMTMLPPSAVKLSPDPIVMLPPSTLKLILPGLVVVPAALKLKFEPMLKPPAVELVPEFTVMAPLLAICELTRGKLVGVPLSAPAVMLPSSVTTPGAVIVTPVAPVIAALTVTLPADALLCSNTALALIGLEVVMLPLAFKFNKPLLVEREPDVFMLALLPVVVTASWLPTAEAARVTAPAFET